MSAAHVAYYNLLASRAILLILFTFYGSLSSTINIKVVCTMQCQSYGVRSPALAPPPPPHPVNPSLIARVRLSFSSGHTRSPPSWRERYRSGWRPKRVPEPHRLRGVYLQLTTMDKCRALDPRALELYTGSTFVTQYANDVWRWWSFVYTLNQVKYEAYYVFGTNAGSRGFPLSVFIIHRTNGNGDVGQFLILE